MFTQTTNVHINNNQNNNEKILKIEKYLKIGKKYYTYYNNVRVNHRVILMHISSRLEQHVYRI